MLVMERMTPAYEDALPAGRGYFFNNPPLLCQLCLPSITANSVSDFGLHPATPMPDLAAQNSMLETNNELRAGYRALSGANGPAPIKELPTRIPLHTLPQPTDRSHLMTTIGCYDDDQLSSYMLDWDASGPHFIVAGPPGSGKTNLLHTAILAAAEQYSPQDLRFILIDFNERSLRQFRSLKHVIQHVTNVLEFPPFLATLQHELRAFHEHDSNEPAPRTILIIDDYDAASEALSTQPDTLRQMRDQVRLYSNTGLHLWVAGYMERTGDPLMKQLMLRRSGFGLVTKDSLQKLNIRTTGLPHETMPEGRAYFPQSNIIHVLQTALVEDPAYYVQRINAIWGDYDRATWQHRTTNTPPPQPQPSPVEDITNDFAVDIDTAGG
jgi:hypothetical protein